MAKRRNPKRANKGVSTSDSQQPDTIDVTAVDVSETSVDVPDNQEKQLDSGDSDAFTADETTEAVPDTDTLADTDLDVETSQDVPTEAEADVSETQEVTDESDEFEPEAEDAFVPAPVPVAPEPKRASILPMILAGIVTAILGFLAARSDLLVDSPQATAPEADPAIAAGLAHATDRLTALEATVAALPEPQAPAEAAAVDLDPINTQISDLSERTDALAPLSDRVTALTEQVDTLAARPPVDVTVPEEALNAALAQLRETSASQQAEIDTQQTELDAQQAKIDGLIAEALQIQSDTEAEANATLQRAALARIMTAVDTGSPFATELGDLEAAGETDVPDALKSAADEGVPPLAVLQDAFPDAARSALAAARTNSEEDSGLGGFFQRQLGARSTAPREGSDPDAVLSRMDAAMSAGNLEDTLAEVDQLPDPAREAMATWLEQAQMRYDAVSAAKTLADRLSAL